MEILLVKKSRIPDRKRFWLPVIPGLLLLGWNIANLLRLPFIKTFAGDMTAIWLSAYGSDFSGMYPLWTDTDQQPLF